MNYHSTRWQRKSEHIKRRDGYQCQLCKRYGKLTPAKIVHHIKPAEEYPELIWEDSNMISLCIACHNRIHEEKGRAGLRAMHREQPY